MYAQGRRLHVHTPQVLGCTPPTIIHHFSFQSAPCHDIQRFTSHTRTKSHIEVYPLSTQSMFTTTATRWCPIGIVIHGYRRCQINGTSIFRQLIRFHPHRIKTLRLSKVLIHIKTRKTHRRRVFCGFALQLRFRPSGWLRLRLGKRQMLPLERPTWPWWPTIPAIPATAVAAAVQVLGLSSSSSLFALS